MFKSYLTIAWRNLLRNKIYTFINVAGLSIGLACAMLIMLYVKDEVSYDRFHANVGQIYISVFGDAYSHKRRIGTAVKIDRRQLHRTVVEGYSRQ